MTTRLTFAALATLVLAACEDPARTVAPTAERPAANAGAHSGYTITDLGTLGGTYSWAEEINDHGVVVGVSETSTGVTRAFVWSPGPGHRPGTMEDLGTLPGWAGSGALGINDRGDVVGYVVNAEGTLSRPVRWNRHGAGYVIEELEHLGGHKGAGNAINNRGDVSGASCPPELKSHVMIWSRNGNRNLGTNGGIATIAFDINDHGQLAATRDLGEHFSYGYLWTEEAGFRDIGHLGGTGPMDGTIAWALNSRAEITGISTTADGMGHAFVWSEQRGMEDLGTLGGPHSEGLDINDSGQIVGGSYTADGNYHAFIWSRDGGMRDVGGLFPGGINWGATINPRGVIAGGGYTPAGELRAVVWTPRAAE